MGIYNFNSEDAIRFASHVHIKTRTRGKELQFVSCPYCRAKDKFTFSINLDNGTYNCKRSTCGKHGNMIALAQDFDFSLGQEADEYFNRKKRYKNLSNYPRPEVRTRAVEYMEGRGISKEITEKYSITTRKDNENVLVFPFFDEDGKMQFVKYRNTAFQKGDNGSKEWCERDCKPILFGMDQCNLENKTLVLTEGQIDSLSVAECGIENAVSVPTGAKGFTWVPYCWDFLGKFETLIVFGDHENGHITLLDEMKMRFNGAVKHVREGDYLDCKDANELLQRHGRNAVINAVANAEPVKNSHIKEMSDVEHVDITKKERISTGFANLDKVLGGFFIERLVIVTGERGTGKSTLGSQFCLQALHEGYSVFLYSGEMTDWSVREWIDRQAAGPEYISKTETQFGDVYTVNNSVVDDIGSWYRGRCFIYDNGIVDDEAEEETLLTTIETSIKQYGCRVLLIDNLMTAMEDDPSSDLYRLQTAFVRKLALMVVKFKVLIFLVVHPRKAIGSSERRNDDVSGSSNITNLADVVIWYERNEDNDEYDRAIRVTKNRPNNGKLTASGGIHLWFDEASKRISERAGWFDWRLGWEPPASDSPDEFIVADDFESGEIPF